MADKNYQKIFGLDSGLQPDKMEYNLYFNVNVSCFITFYLF